MRKKNRFLLWTLIFINDILDKAMLVSKDARQISFLNQMKEFIIMRKKLLSAAVLLGITSMLCGFDQAETAESILQKQQEAVSAAESTSASITINADVSIDLAGAALTAAANGEIALDILSEGPDLRLEGSIDALSPLLAQENTYDFRFFVKNNAYDSPDIYVYYSNAVTGESYWDHDSAKGVDVDSLIRLSSSLNAEKLAALGIEFSLAPEAVENGETECYQLSTTLDAAAFSTLLTKLSELSGQDLSANESVILAMKLLDGLKINLSYDIDTTTFLPVSIHLDLNDSELSTVEELLSSYLNSAIGGDEPLTVGISLNDVSVDAVTTYNTVSEIIVPDEALSADASPDVIPDETEAELVSFLGSVANSAQ